jgi:hypothetical protein
MMNGRVREVTKSVDDICRETSTEKSGTTLRSQKFWNACQAAQGSNDTLAKAGFLVSYVPNDEGKVETVTLTLNGTWQAILQRVLDRRP